MTLLQLLQFFGGNAVCSYPYFHPGCLSSEEKTWLTVVLSYTSALIILFTNFAIGAYCKRKPDKAVAGKAE